MYAKNPTKEELDAGFVVGRPPKTERGDDFASLAGGSSLDNLPNEQAVYRILPGDKIVIKMQIPGTEETEYTVFRWDTERETWAPEDKVSFIKTLMLKYPKK